MRYRLQKLFSILLLASMFSTPFFCVHSAFAQGNQRLDKITKEAYDTAVEGAKEGDPGKTIGGALVVAVVIGTGIAFSVGLSKR